MWCLVRNKGFKCQEGDEDSSSPSFPDAEEQESFSREAEGIPKAIWYYSTTSFPEKRLIDSLNMEAGHVTNRVKKPDPRAQILVLNKCCQ